MANVNHKKFYIKKLRFILSLSKKIKNNWGEKVVRRAHGREREFCRKIAEKYASHCFDREAQGEKSVMRPTEKVMHAIR